MEYKRKTKRRDGFGKRTHLLLRWHLCSGSCPLDWKLCTGTQLNGRPFYNLRPGTAESIACHCPEIAWKIDVVCQLGWLRLEGLWCECMVCVYGVSVLFECMLWVYWLSVMLWVYLLFEYMLWVYGLSVCC